MMKRIALLLCLFCLSAAAAAQEHANPTKQDTLYGENIVNNYLSFVDFDRLLDDSMLCVVTYITERSHPHDTMTLYHWYMKGNRMRVEMWQDGKIQEGLYTDGTAIFREFRSSVRSWTDMTQNNFYDKTMPLDVRGALYNWKSKGAEMYFAGNYTFEGHPVNRVFVTSPGLFDRYYFFETQTGLLFMVQELDKLYGDGKQTKTATRVDWRAWNEFTPMGDCLLPSIESYQYQGEVVVLNRHYQLTAEQPTLFTEDYHRMP